MIKIFTDGGSRGNPGESACACAFFDPTGEKIFEASKYLGIKTNNESEYNGVILALSGLEKNFAKEKKIEFYLDSKLVVEQLSGRWKIKDEKIKNLAKICKNKIADLELIATFSHVPRAENKIADELVNKCLDEA